MSGKEVSRSVFLADLGVNCSWENCPLGEIVRGGTVRRGIVRGRFYRSPHDPHLKWI